MPDTKKEKKRVQVLRAQLALPPESYSQKALTKTVARARNRLYPPPRSKAAHCLNEIE